MKISYTILFVFLTSLTFGQRDFSKVTIKETALTDNIYMLEGSGGNIMLLVGKEEVLMVDSQFAGLSDKIKEKIKTLAGAKEIKYLVNTHYHGDHTGGNDNFRPATIVAHKNVRERLSTDQYSKAFNRTTKAKAATYYPDFTYNNEMQFYFADQQITLVHMENAHTDGDSGVFLADANIIHMGDTFFKDRFPYIDLSAGGSINGLIEGFKGMLLFMDEETKIVPGHGALAGLGDAESYLEMLVTMRDRVQESIKAGMSIEEIKAAGLDKGFESWGTGFISGEKFVDTIWTDLERKQE
jgi:glyoxylase-like metal-dependent hydrolase (beta-lactamase superfamily II)